MTKPTKSISIVSQPAQPTLSKAQKAFNALIKKIEASRKTLALWQASFEQYQQKIASDFNPALRRYHDVQADMARALDQAIDRKGLSKTERDTARRMLCEMVEGVIEATGDESLKALYNKHSPTDFDTEAAEDLDLTKELLSTVFGVDAGDIADAQSTADVFAELEAAMEAKQRARQEADSKRRESKKTAKQLAKEAKLKAEADETTLSLREVYKKLVSALHPDREPDATERTRKTALMQRVNQAYEKKDLLQLLELQLEIEQISVGTIANLSETRLKHFNKILEEQWVELQQAISGFEMPLREQFDLAYHQSLSPDAALPLLKKDIAAIIRDTKIIQKDVLAISDLAKFKAWLKARQREHKESDQYGDDGDFRFF